MMDVAKMSRKEFNAEIIHLTREQEEYERKIAELEERISDLDRVNKQFCKALLDIDGFVFGNDMISKLARHEIQKIIHIAA